MNVEISHAKWTKILGGDPSKAIAPFVPTPRWLEGYFKVLHEVGLPRQEHSFCVHWVRPFFHRNPGKARRSLGAEDIAGFLGLLTILR